MPQQREKRNFLRMNSDDSPLAVPVGDVLSMLNCRVYPTMVKNVPGNTLIAANPFTSEQTFEATCNSFYTGDPVSRTATATSYDSQAAADALAMAKAKAEAEAALVCVLRPTAWRVKASSQYCVQS